MKREKITAVLFITLISLIFSIIIINARLVGYSMLKGYKEYLPQNYSLFDIIKASTNSTTESIDTIIYNNNLIIDFFGIAARVLDKRVLEDKDSTYTVYKMDNGQLTFLYPEYNVQNCANQVVELYNLLGNNNADMLFVQAPFKINKYNPLLPTGMPDTVNANTDAFLKVLAENDVPYYDSREVIHNLNMPYADLFFNTDHHWKVETAFWAYTQVMKKISDDYGYEINLERLDPDQFQLTKYRDACLGSQGRRVGRFYGGVDDYTVITPKFKTSYVIYTDSAKEITIPEGSFTDTVINEDKIGEKASRDTDCYMAYFGENYSRIRIINNEVDEGKILILQDSFGRPFSSFVALNFHETDILDLRLYREESLFYHLKKNKYDLVLIIYNPSTLSSGFNETLYQFK